MHSDKSRSQSRSRNFGMTISLGAMLMGGGAFAKPPVKPKPASKPAALPVPARAQLAYNLQTGKSYRYKIVLLLDGHIPGLNPPAGPPIHIIADLIYVAAVKKQDEKGIETAFTVESAALGILEKEVGADGKISADNTQFPFPISHEQVQSMFNVTALLHPDGSVASVSGGSSPLRIEIGVDLRKLFIAAVLPVVFPQTPLKTGDTWPFQEGALGRKPGATTYTGRLNAIRPDAANLNFEVSQEAQTQIASKLNKEGNSTDKAAEAVGTLDGKVAAVGTMQFMAAPPPKTIAATMPPLYGGSQSQGRMTLNILLKKAMPDPDHPGQKNETPIDARCRLFVTAMSDAVKPVTNSDPAKTDPKPATGGIKKGKMKHS